MNITSPLFDDNELALVKQVLDSRWVTQGPMTRRFEELVGKRQNAKHALATTSCTAALHLATLALGLTSGDEVVVPAFTWVTSAHCAEYVGARAVFADIDLSTFNLDPAAFAAAITPRTKAVIAVHLFGHAAAMDEILAIAHPRGIRVIEDAACAIGTDYGGRPVGAIGDLGCFSFHPRKVVTTGEGGLVTTDDDALAARVMSARNHGASGHPGPAPAKPFTMGRFEELGFNLRLSDIQAAVGVAQMAKLEALLNERKLLASSYLDHLRTVAGIALPRAAPRCGHTYQSFVIRVLDGGIPRRNRIMERLASVDIQTRPGTHAVHRLGYYQRKYAIRAEQFPNACVAEDSSITLPIFPGMSARDQDTVTTTLKSALEER